MFEGNPTLLNYIKKHDPELCEIMTDVLLRIGHKDVKTIYNLWETLFLNIWRLVHAATQNPPIYLHVTHFIEYANKRVLELLQMSEKYKETQEWKNSHRKKPERY